MQTILGSNGSIGVQIARELPKYTDKIRLVSRNPKKVNPNDELVSANLLDAEQTDRAVKGSEIVYLTVGLKYRYKVWKKQWPLIMRNVIDACKKYQSKLVFFDNVYMYGRVEGWMTEETPHNPSSKKGWVRQEVVQMIFDEIEAGTLNALVARSADFYGKSPVSVVGLLVFNKYAKNLAAQLLIDDKKVHSYTYIPDAGKATALLGNTHDAYNQVWHLPTDSYELTGKELVEKAAEAFGVPAKYQVLKPWMLWMSSVFYRDIAAMMELMYQNKYDYKFDSSKFQKKFPDFKVTTYDEGIIETANLYKEST